MHAGDSVGMPSAMLEISVTYELQYYKRNWSWIHNNNTVCAFVTDQASALNQMFMLCLVECIGILVLLILATV